MKILMIAPEPFFRERGTPFSIRQRLEALSELGYKVDLLTYPFGRDINLNGLRIFRSYRPFWIKDVKIGPSWGKIPLDFFLFLQAIIFIFQRGYDCIHTHEEAGFFGALIERLFRLPHIYDMHSSLPEQLVNYQFICSPSLVKLAQKAECWLLKNSRAIIAICPYLANWAKERVKENRVFLIENLPVRPNKIKDSKKGIDLLKRLKEEGNKIILYTGNFEYNQGVDLLIEAARLVTRTYPRVKFVLVGGKEKEIQRFWKLVERWGLKKEIIFVGKKPFEEIDAFMEGGDILLSPRRIGNNTPLKIYSYLFSGKPIVATNISSHTQVLNEERAILTETSGEGIAQGILKLLENRDLGERLAQKALEYASQRFSPEQYLSKIKGLYQFVGEKKWNLKS